MWISVTNKSAIKSTRQMHIKWLESFFLGKCLIRSIHRIVYCVASILISFHIRKGIYWALKLKDKCIINTSQFNKMCIWCAILWIASIRFIWNWMAVKGKITAENRSPILFSPFQFSYRCSIVFTWNVVLKMNWNHFHSFPVFSVFSVIIFPLVKVLSKWSQLLLNGSWNHLGDSECNSSWKIISLEIQPCTFWTVLYFACQISKQQRLYLLFQTNGLLVIVIYIYAPVYAYWITILI